MADDSNPPPPDTQQPPAPAPQGQAPSALTITPEIQAAIDAAARDAATKAHNAAWKQAREKYEKPANGGHQQPPTPPKQDPPPNGNGQDALAIIALRDAFDDAISDLSLSGAQKKFVRELVMKERPSDVADYVSNFVTLSGWNNKPTPAAPATGSQPAQPANPASPAGPPVTSRGAPPPAGTPTDDTPILSLSESDRKALIAKIGDVKYAERMLKEMARDNVRVRSRIV